MHSFGFLLFHLAATFPTTAGTTETEAGDGHPNDVDQSDHEAGDNAGEVQ